MVFYVKYRSVCVKKALKYVIFQRFFCLAAGKAAALAKNADVE